MGSGRRSRSSKRQSKRRRRRNYSSSSTSTVSSKENDYHSLRLSKKSKNHRKDKERQSHISQKGHKSCHIRGNDNHIIREGLLTPVTPVNPNVREFSCTNSVTQDVPTTSQTNVIPVHYANNNPMFAHTFASHMNVIPEFDPSDGSQNIESWIHKVTECAQIYSWNEMQICHYALAKLTGLAKRWYQGLPSLLFTWEQWKCKLKAAFPSTENYGDLLQRMLQLRCKIGQPLDIYYYEKK